MPWSFSQHAVWQHYLWRFLREIVKKLKLPDKALRTLSLSLFLLWTATAPINFAGMQTGACRKKLFSSRHKPNSCLPSAGRGVFLPTQKTLTMHKYLRNKAKNKVEEMKKYAPFCSFAVHFVSGITVINIINATHVLSQLVQVLTVIHDWWKTICYAASSAGSRVNREERKIL